MRIPLSRPDITDLEKEKVLEVLNTPNLSLGPKLDEFEEKFANYIGSKYAIAVNSGTSGLHTCIKALDIKDGDVVFTTPFSFISSANCILFERAKPFFIDIDEKTINIDANKLCDTAKKFKDNNQSMTAILPVHIFGRPCEMEEIMELAEKHELKVIEDACEAIGAKYLYVNPKAPIFEDRNIRKKAGAEISINKSIIHEKSDDNKGNHKETSKKDAIWKKVGTFGDCGTFAFYPNKQITTGEGGMIVTDDENINMLCRSLRNQGRSENRGWLQHARLGYNYRMSDINCALGIAQLERIDEILSKREKVARLYNERLEETEELTIPQFEENKKISWFVYVVRLTNKFSREDRNLILNRLKKKGIGCSNYFSPIHIQPFYGKIFGYKKGDFPIAEKVSERTIALPFYNNLKEEQIDCVCENLINIINHI